ncbi:glycine dehydrogenase [Rhizoctonia solani]|uniref:glycine dehydrogenase (aminomethyl-transferring) n=1 Tax=Rhizoctonia solani TaxID=456999 RepID=A0A8H8T0C0_9AGAM|nr:glycine dehydrogenase [Rhizoctonia solani]QRW24524.1 glycine dehydrogenase [Rhizoctonia solani]
MSLLSLREALNRSKDKWKKRASRDAWHEIRSLLDQLEFGAGVFGPLKSVIGSIRQAKGIQSTTEQSRVVLKDIAEYMNSPMVYTMTDSVKLICAIKVVEERQGQRTGRKLVDAMDGLDRVTEGYERIQQHLERLTLNLNLGMLKGITEQAMELKLTKLSPSMSAIYNSAESDDIKRGSCTPGTRKPQIDLLLEWAHTPDAGKTCWMNGMAGTGKTTIAYSVCSGLEKASQLGASFFCSRVIPECRQVRRIIPSIAYQLARFLFLSDSDTVKADIATYLRHELKHIPLDDAQWSSIIASCGVLFIYASTTCRYIKEAHAVDTLDEAVSAIVDTSSNASNQEGGNPIDQLYLTILTAAFESPRMNTPNKIRMQKLLETVICVAEPITTDALAALLDLKSAKQVDGLLQPLRSVLNIAPITGLVATLHASFPDFMLSEYRSAPFHCKPATRHLAIAEACLRIIDATEPKHNICGLSSSYMFDDEVPDLKERVIQNIPLLLWMEIMSLTKHIGYGMIVIRDAEKWCYEKAAPVDITKLVHDAWEFVSVYANHRYARVPRIYTSMLPFWPSSRPVSTIYMPRTAGLVKPKGAWIESIGLSADGTRLVVPTEDGIDILDTTTGNSIRSLTNEHTKNIRIACGLSDGDLYIHVLQPEARILGPLKGHTRHIHSVAFSPDGLYLASGSWGDTIRIWMYELEKWPVNLLTIMPLMSYHYAFLLMGPVLHRLLPPLSRHLRNLKCIAFSPNGVLVACGSADKTIRVYDAHTGQTVLGPLEGHTDEVDSIIFFPDSSRIFSCSRDGTIRIWNVEDLATDGADSLSTSLVLPQPIYSIRYSHDGLRVASGSENGDIHVWNAESGELVLGPLCGHRGTVRSLDYSSKNTHIASASADYTVRIWDTETGKDIHGPMRGHTGQVACVRFSPHGSIIASGSIDYTLRLWDVASGREIAMASSPWTMSTMHSTMMVSRSIPRLRLVPRLFPRLGLRSTGKSNGKTVPSARHVPGPTHRPEPSRGKADARCSRIRLDGRVCEGYSPDSIRIDAQAVSEHSIPALSESEMLRRAEEVANMNERNAASSVILRNVLENPSWYTPYTPYQPEIAQGRLESLINFQTMVSSLTGLPIANASLLDEGTAAAEAMVMAFAQHGQKRKTFVVDQGVSPQSLAVLRTRAGGFGIRLVVGDVAKLIGEGESRQFGNDCVELSDLAGVLVQYPDVNGSITDYALLKHIKEASSGPAPLLACATDLLALAILTPPGELGFDIALGSSARFGVPVGYGGPHAAFFSVADALKRKIPGRLVGRSRDANGRPAYRLALQTREQHIRREKATSNICTSQALLANTAAMYAVWHGAEGVRAIAERVLGMTAVLDGIIKVIDGMEVQNTSGHFFDTLTIDTGSAQKAAKIHAEAAKRAYNLRIVDERTVGVTFDESVTEEELAGIANCFLIAGGQAPIASTDLASFVKGGITPLIDADAVSPAHAPQAHSSTSELLQSVLRNFVVPLPF